MSALSETIILPSGSKFRLQDADFELSFELGQAILRELLAVKIDLKIDVSKIDPSNPMASLGEMDLPLDVLKNAIFSVLASREVRRLVDQAMTPCLYNGIRVDSKTFADRAARGDYLPAAWEVIKYNVGPFLGALLSKSSTESGESSNSRE